MASSVKSSKRLQEHLKRRVEQFSRAGKLKVGFLKGATYPDENHTPVAQVAAWNEFGTDTSPARPFFRGMIDDYSHQWGELFAASLDASGGDIKNAIRLSGEEIASQLDQSIIDLVNPPLSPITIEKKGDSKPLIHTKTMKRAVSFEVEE